MKYFFEGRFMKRHLYILLVIVVIAASALRADAAIMDSINAGQEPADSPWGVIKEVGWVYTPDEPYYLTGVESKFGPSSTSILPPFPGTSVTVEVYDEVPGSGGTLLRTTSFGLFRWGVFTGGSFASLELTGGEDYFIGFAFTGPVILKNSTFDIDSVVALPCYGDEAVDGTYSDLLTNPTEIHPILRFEGEPIPEPATVLLLGLGGAVLLKKKRRSFI
jgi:hypothetical protein